MIQILKNNFLNIVTISLVAMFFSCTNSTKEVRDLLADKNMPIGVANNINHIYKDSGRITSRLVASLLYDFSNRQAHPYSEFPEGIKIVSIGNKGIDSTTILGNYGVSYVKTGVSEIKGNVVVLNHTDNVKLETNQLFWDQKERYFFTEDGFRLTTLTDTINGFGFEANENLTKWIAKDITGDVLAKKNQL